MYSSRSCAPLPVMLMATGRRPRAATGFVNVPPSECPNVVGTVTCSAEYGAPAGAGYAGLPIAIFDAASPFTRVTTSACDGTPARIT